MTAPAAILASSVSIRSLSDGTLRLSVDIEPSDAQAAFALFGKPGSPIAIARVTNESAVAHDRRQQEQPAERKPLSLASKVALTCQELSFADFLRAFDPDGFGAVEDSGWAEPAGQYVRDFCGVTSRAEIKPDTRAAGLWEDLRAEYEHFQRTGRAA